MSTNCTSASWGVPSPGSHGHAHTALRPFQLKPWLAGEGTRGGEGEAPIEMGAVHLSMLWSPEHWAGNGCKGEEACFKQELGEQEAELLG